MIHYKVSDDKSGTLFFVQMDYQGPFGYRLSWIVMACFGSHVVHVHGNIFFSSYDVKLENAHFSYTGEEKDEMLHGISL